MADLAGRSKGQTLRKQLLRSTQSSPGGQDCTVTQKLLNGQRQLQARSRPQTHLFLAWVFALHNTTPSQGPVYPRERSPLAAAAHPGRQDVASASALPDVASYQGAAPLTLTSEGPLQ